MDYLNAFFSKNSFQIKIIHIQSAANFAGTDSFTYTVSDDQGNTSNVATVSITVNNVNDVPTFGSAPVTEAAATTPTSPRTCGRSCPRTVSA